MVAFKLLPTLRNLLRNPLYTALNLSGLAIGMAAAMLIIFLIELIGSSLFPVDIDVQSADAATMARIIAEMPLAAKLFVVVGWALGSFGGAWLALHPGHWPADCARSRQPTSVVPPRAEQQPGD